MPTVDLAKISHAFASFVNFSAPTWDVFIMLFFVIASLLYGFALGRDRVAMLLVAIYMALAVVGNAPYLDELRARIVAGNLFAFQITTFLGLFLILFFFLSRSALHRTFGAGYQGNWWQTLLFSFLHVGLLLSIVLSFLPPTALSRLLPLTRELFVSDLARFLWITLPILAMLLVKPEKSERV